MVPFSSTASLFCSYSFLDFKYLFDIFYCYMLKNQTNKNEEKCETAYTLSFKIFMLLCFMLSKKAQITTKNILKLSEQKFLFWNFLVPLGMSIFWC